MRRSLTLLLTACTALAAACDDGASTLAPEDGPTPNLGGIWAGNLAVTSVPDGITLGNNTTRRVHYLVLERGLAARALWAPCVRRDCPGLAPAERRTLRAADIAGVDAANREVVVYWYHVVDGRDGQPTADSIRTVVARVGG
jgi:hypothetical protein